MCHYAATVLIFLAIDVVIKTLVMKPLFTHHPGDAMQESPMMAPVGLFYQAYIAGLMFPVSASPLRDAAPTRAPRHGPIVGAKAYRDYEGLAPAEGSR